MLHILRTNKSQILYSDKLAVSRQSVRGAGLDAVETVVTNEYGKSDDRLRSTTVSVTVNGRSTDKRQITYDYDRLGRLAKVIRPLTSPSRSGIAYSYNIQGWVDKIETGSFSESLHYNEGPGRHLFNGNVSSVSWSRKGEAGNRGYKFDYDRLNRLTGAEYGEKDFSQATGRYDERLRYDADGNVQALSRNGRKQNGSYGPVDDLEMSYDGCQLSAVEESAAPVLSANSYDLKRGSDEFSYDANGALTMDGTRGITSITYDYSGYPTRVQFDNGNVTKYVYTSTGQKLRAVYYTAMPNVRVGMGMDYEGIEDNHLSVDSVDYLLGGTVLCRNGRATQILFDGGYVKVERRMPGLWTNPSLLSLIPNVPIITNDSLVLQPNPADTLRLTFKYFNRDHLGNIREVIGEDGGVEQVTDYYPFGLPIGDLGRNSGLQRFKYNGKEFDEMHGLNTYDYGARQYNPVLARWDRMDPLVLLREYISPYNFCQNNPIRRIDRNGALDDDYIFNVDGDYVRTDKNNFADRLVVEDFNTHSKKYYQFADPDTDTKNISDGVINKVVFVSEKKIEKILTNAGAFDAGNREDNWIYMKRESKGGGYLDFSYSAIPHEFAGASRNPLRNESPMLFIPEGDNYAHNHMNFGNFLWGAAGHSLGFSKWILKSAAHYNSIMNSATNGYSPQMDSSDDQLSIERGVIYSEIFLFRNKTFSQKSGATAHFQR